METKYVKEKNTRKPEDFVNIEYEMASEENNEFNVTIKLKRVEFRYVKSMFDMLIDYTKSLDKQHILYQNASELPLEICRQLAEHINNEAYNNWDNYLKRQSL